MRLPALAAALALIASTGEAQTLTGIDWELLAIDGKVVDIPATLRLEDDGAVSGEAPCNNWSSRNSASLPDLKLTGLRATRMACDRLEDEQHFFDAVTRMQGLALEGDRNLILTGPDGRSMEFVPDVMNNLTRCTTCPPAE